MTRKIIKKTVCEYAGNLDEDGDNDIVAASGVIGNNEVRWDKAMQYIMNQGVHGICPLGWHLPTDSELTTLSQGLGGDYIAGGHLKEPGLTHWKNLNTGADNNSGFTSLPAGAYFLGAFGYGFESFLQY